MKNPPPIPQPKLKSGKKIAGGRYELESLLGEGGNGVVWLAHHTGIGSKVVVKFPLNNRMQEESQLKIEIESLAKYSNQHPNIVNIIDAGFEDRTIFIVMQYLRNGSLDDYLLGSESKNTDNNQLCRNPDWFVKTGQAIDYLHQNGVLHRDIKPSNILFDDSMSPYLCDFGLADRVEMLSESQPDKDSKIAGSLPYMSPELLESGEYSKFSDQFSFAVTAFEFSSGHRPFHGKTAAELLRAHQDVPSLVSRMQKEISADVATVFSLAFAFKPADRFASCEAMAVELAKYWNQLPLAFAPYDTVAEAVPTKASQQFEETDRLDLEKKPPIPVKQPDSPPKERTLDLDKLFRSSDGE